MSRESHESEPSSTELVRNHDAATDLLRETYDEMVRQDAQWSWPRDPNFLTGNPALQTCMLTAEKLARDSLAGRPNWLAILVEEVGEAAREKHPGDLVKELVQVAAVALAWAQSLQEQAYE